MKFKKWLKAFLRTEQKYHQALNRLASPKDDNETLYGVFEDKPVPEKKELLKYLREKILAEIEQNNEKINNPKEILDSVELVRKDRESDRLYNLTNNEKKERLLKLYKELEKAEKESKDNEGVTSHDNLIKNIRKELEKYN